MPILGAIEPLWKGQRFRLERCISGWAMRNRRSVAIEDIYVDDRIPHDAYRPTFVKSLAMVPIRKLDPVGAIGNYWATSRRPTEGEVTLLQALADSTAVAIAIENVRAYEQIKAHAEAGASILDSTTSDVVRVGRLIARTHHEWWDGTGYPHGVAGHVDPAQRTHRGAGRRLRCVDERAPVAPLAAYTRDSVRNPPNRSI
jgi:GAF domain-containing protein